MFERFTDRARRLTVLAQEEARMLNHNYIGTEHLLLGMIHEGEGVACKALEALGLSLEGVRSQVEEIIGRGEQAPSGHIPFTPRAKRVLELSLREALQLGNNYIGTEHVLLGLIREGDGVASQVLVKLGAELTRVRQVVIQILGGYTAENVRKDEEKRKREARAELKPWTLVEFDQKIAEVRREKESRIDAQDYSGAASLRDQEKQLIAKRNIEERHQRLANAEVSEAAQAINQVVALTTILTKHGVEPRGGLMEALFEWRGPVA